MPRLLFFLGSFLFACTCGSAQIARPSLACIETSLGKLPVGLTLIRDPSNIGTVLNPGVPLRILQSVDGGNPNGFVNIPFIVGSYPGTLHCSLQSGAVTAIFDLPVVLDVVNGGTAYSVSVSSFTGTFNIGAAGSLTLTLPGGSTGPQPTLQNWSSILPSDANLLLSSTPAPTPLPSSLILTLIGLASIGLITGRSKLRRYVS
jgi:hypothetical protein